MENKFEETKISNVLKKIAGEYLDREIKKNNGSIYEEEPVKSKEFFDKWIGTPLYPIQQQAIDDILIDINPETGEMKWNTTYNEAYLLWGEGAGKDYVCACIVAYAAYWLMCLKSPQKYFNMADKAPLDIVNVSFDEQQAQNVFFAYLKRIMNSVVNPATGKKWFVEKGMKISETSKTQSIAFPKYITAYSLNSREYKAEGKSILIAIFDEMAVFKVDKAEELFKNLRGSANSRFPKEHKLIAISYKRDDYDYMMVRWDETKDNPRVYRSGPKATWDVNLRVKKEDFADAYIENPEDSERRYECTGKTLKAGYFKYRDKIQQNINYSRISPVMEEVIPIRNIIGIQFYDWFVGKDYTDYVAHVDLAKGKDTDSGKADCVGIAMGHKEIVDGDEGKPKIVIDLMLQLKAKPGEEIIFEHIRQLLINLHTERKFILQKVTLDGYQSTDFIQQLRMKGIQSEELSVDKDNSAYDTCKGLIYQARLDYYNYPVFIRECEELMLVGGKVDHPEISRRRAMEEKDDRGSKDVSDAVASVCKTLIGDIKSRVGVTFTNLTEENTGVSRDGNTVYADDDD